MRKMRKYRLAGIIASVFICLMDYTTAQENFEDADKLSDLMSATTGQHFDLRHTIPGIPEVDYPIYSEVPKTSFECAGRHEGYYADIESRCQAFRICTYTARGVSGFGFLCPNGTLFSQQHFVCDWYRNVNCEDSERYYNKNDENRIGSSLDMMETVRQMMEYPMKTISKALQQNPGSSRKPAQRHRGANKGNQQSNGSDNASVQAERQQNNANSARKSVTRAQVESAHSRGMKKYNHHHEEETVASNESSNTVKHSYAKSSAEEETTSQVADSSSSNAEEDVYVNSLGELSTDPGVHFDRTNAHIIAEPRRYRYEKKNNFAVKVNDALNDAADVSAGEKIAPDYVKQMRSSSDFESAQTNLASNINGLLDEVANDLNPSTSGYQIQAPAKTKHAFRFLSRGFSSQDDPYKYKKPKQTASTIRFTPNQLPAATEKLPKKPVFEIAEDAAGFGQSSTTTTTLEPPLFGGALDYLLPPVESPTFEENSYLEPPLLPPIQSPPTTVEPNEAESIITTTPENEVYTVTPSSADLPVYAAFVDTTTEAQSNFESTSTASPDIAQNLVVSQQQQESQNQKIKEDEDAPIDEDRLDVNKEAEKLFFSGLKLTTNENETEVTTLGTPLLIQVAEDHSYLTAWVTSTSTQAPVTETLPATTTEATAAVIVAETGSFKERIRNYRRLASLQRATTKPVIYGKRGHLRLSTKSTTNASTTPKSTATTRNYLKRVAASRLRLSRLAAAAANKNNNHKSTTTASAISPGDNSINAGDDKKLSVRNIDKETAIAGNALEETADAAKAQAPVTWESVRNSLKRFQAGRKKSTNHKNHEEESNKNTTPSTVVEVSTTARISLMRSRNRFANFKMAASLRNRESNNSPTTAAVPTSVSQTVSSSYSPSSNLALPLSFLNTHISQPQSPSNGQGSVVSNTASMADNTNLNSNSATSSDSPNFISFDKLTRSIVDDSILQNYRAAPTLGRSSLNTIAAPNAQHSGTLSSSYSTSGSNSNLNAYQVSSRNAYSNQVFETPARHSFSRIAHPAPTQLPPQQQQPTNFSAYQAQTSAPLFRTTPGPRIVIARAEGQRIESNSVSSIISTLITQQQQKSPPKPTPTTSYMSLDDFLTKKFGNQAPTKATQIAATYYQQPQQQQTRPSIAQQYQPQQQQQQHTYHQQPSQQHILTSLAPPQPTLATIFTTQNQQQSQQQQQHQHQTLFNQPSQLASATPTLQPFMTQHIFDNYQQQQQQLPQFPPLATQSPLQPPPQATSSQSFQNLAPQFNGGSNYLNVQLPTLTNSLIPVPTAQTALRRSDVSADNLNYTAYAPLRSVSSGATSYDVPLSSVGRLPNDITALLRRLRKY